MVKVFSVTLFFFYSIIYYGQDPVSFRIKKSELIYFFQTGNACDTVYADNCNKFYLLINDSLKKHVSIQIDNAQIQKTKNDSIVVLKYLPGLKYETIFERKDTLISTSKRNIKRRVVVPFVMQTRIDGVSDYSRQKIRILFYDLREEKKLLENVFFAKP